MCLPNIKNIPPFKCKLLNFFENQIKNNFSTREGFCQYILYIFIKLKVEKSKRADWGQFLTKKVCLSEIYKKCHLGEVALLNENTLIFPCVFRCNSYTRVQNP